MKKTAAVLLFIAFLLPFSAIAAPQNRGASDGFPKGKERIREITELRQLNSETYLLEDGSYECEISSENKYYYDEEGQLKPIDNSLVEKETVFDGKQFDYSNKANDLMAYFSEASAETMIVYHGLPLCFHPSIIGRMCASFDLTGMPEVCTEFGLTGGNCILYPNAFSNADLIYAVRNNGLTSGILIPSGCEGGCYEFTFDTRGYSVSTYRNKIHFSSIEKDVEFDFELRSIWYGDVDHSSNVEFNTSFLQENALTVSIPIDSGSIGGMRYEDPILIETSLTITGTANTKDSYVASKNPTTNYGSSTLLKTGRDNSCYIRRSYIKFAINASIDPDNVTSAYIKIKKNGTTTPTIKAYRVTSSWNQNTITWNNRPTNASASASGIAAVLSDNWYRMYVTNVTKNFIAGTYTNYGFMIKDETEGDSSHYSSYHSADNNTDKPKLVINYLIPPYYNGARSYDITFSFSVKCMGYALNKINPVSFNMNDATGLTLVQLLAHYKQESITWMNQNLGSNNFYEISSYDSAIPEGWYRAALRVGFDDFDHNGISSLIEQPGYHWWYQTNTGIWAEKQGNDPSRTIAGSAGADPAAFDWSYGSYVFNSNIVYFAIKYTGDPGWQGAV